MCLQGHWVWAGGYRLVYSLHSLWGLPASKMPYGHIVSDRYAPPPNSPKNKKEEGIWEGGETYHQVVKQHICHKYYRLRGTAHVKDQQGFVAQN